MAITLERLGRVLAASTDPTSYRMLLSYLWDRHVDPMALLTEAEGSFGADTRIDEGAEDDGTIPRVLFQTWKSRAQIPSNYAYWHSTFVRLNPNHRVKLWDDADNRRFIAERFSWFLPQYERYPREIFRVDLVRFFFLYEFGGFYADMDSECLRPLDGLGHLGDVVLGRMGRDPDFEHCIPNAIMASKRRQAFWLLAIAMAMERYEAAVRDRTLAQQGPERMTGPILLRDAVAFYLKSAPDDVRARLGPIADHFDLAKCHFGRLTLLDPCRLYPVNWNNPFHQLVRKKMLTKHRVLRPGAARALFPKASVVTYWSHSW